MYIYFFLLALIILFDILSRYSHLKSLPRLLGFVVIFSAIFCIWGFRDFSIGYDTVAYCKYFEAITEESVFHTLLHVEIGYKLLNKLYSIVSDEYRVLLIGNTLLLCLLLWKTLKDNALFPFTSMYLLVVSIYFFTIFDWARQGIAMGIVYAGFGYLRNKQYFYYAAIIILASLFHYSAIALILLIAFLKLKFTILRSLTLICITIAIHIYYNIAISFFSDFFPNFLYLSYFKVENTNRGGTMLLFLSLFMIFLFICLINNLDINRNFEQRLLAWCFLIGTCASILSLKMWWFGRLAIMFNIPVLIFLPNILSQGIRGNLSRFLYFNAIYIIPGMYFIAWIYVVSPVAFGYVPYKFMW